mgnify:CR=1 FL=1
MFALVTLAIVAKARQVVARQVANVLLSLRV